MHWQPYAVVAIGSPACCWSSPPSRRRRCGCRCPSLTAAQPLAGIACGVGFLGDRLRVTPGALAWEAAGLAAIVVGVRAARPPPGDAPGHAPARVGRRDPGDLRRPAGARTAGPGRSGSVSARMALAARSAPPPPRGSRPHATAPPVRGSPARPAGPARPARRDPAAALQVRHPLPGRGTPRKRPMSATSASMPALSARLGGAVSDSTLIARAEPCARGARWRPRRRRAGRTASGIRRRWRSAAPGRRQQHIAIGVAQQVRVEVAGHPHARSRPATGGGAGGRPERAVGSGEFGEPGARGGQAPPGAGRAGARTSGRGRRPPPGRRRRMPHGQLGERVVAPVGPRSGTAPATAR